MIISEKQVLQLMRIAEAYCHAMHQLGQYKMANNIQEILVTINDQQSDEIKCYGND